MWCLPCQRHFCNSVSFCSRTRPRNSSTRALGVRVCVRCTGVLAGTRLASDWPVVTCRPTAFRLPTLPVCPCDCCREKISPNCCGSIWQTEKKKKNPPNKSHSSNFHLSPYSSSSVSFRFSSS